MKEALHSLMEKRAKEMVLVQSSLAFLQQVVSGSKTKQQVDANLRSELVFQDKHFQDRNSKNHKTLLSARRVDHLKCRIRAESITYAIHKKKRGK